MNASGARNGVIVPLNAEPRKTLSPCSDTGWSECSQDVRSILKFSKFYWFAWYIDSSSYISTLPSLLHKLAKMLSHWYTNVEVPAASGARPSLARDKEWGIQTLLHGLKFCCGKFIPIFICPGALWLAFFAREMERLQLEPVEKLSLCLEMKNVGSATWTLDQYRHVFIYKLFNEWRFGTKCKRKIFPKEVKPVDNGKRRKT